MKSWTGCAGDWKRRCETRIMSANNSDKSTAEELALMRMSIKAMREAMNENLDAMLDTINRMLPPEDDKRCLKYKNFDKRQWRDYLDF